jgi:FMN phosphatase YigB (HAD superfamily)
VLFDVGDTLVDTSVLVDRALRESAEHLLFHGLLPSSAEDFVRAYREADAQVQGPGINHLFSGLEILRQAWSLSGLSWSVRSYGTFLGIYRENIRRRIRTEDRLVELFDWLHGKGIRIGVVTDGSTSEQIETLYLLGVVGRVDVLVTSEELMIEKPAPGLFLKAVEDLGVSVRQTLMVGNDVQRDILGARAAGLQTLLVTEYTDASACDSADVGPRTRSVLDLRKLVTNGYEI